ncbi:MAG: hypothetical protein WAO07_14230 [Desulfobacterales bacterium]
MANNPERHQRRSLRLRGFDYDRTGAYFVTICSQGKVCAFGHIVDDEMHLNDAGLIVAEEWVKTATIRSGIDLDEWVVMPNHFHGILMITGLKGTARRAPTV